MKRLKLFGEKGRRSKVADPLKDQETDSDERKPKVSGIFYQLNPKVATLEDAPASLKQSAERAGFVTTGPFMVFPPKLIFKENTDMTIDTENKTATEVAAGNSNPYSYEVKGRLVTAGSELEGYSIFDDISSYEDRYDGRYRVVLSTPVLMKNGTTLPRNFEITDSVEQEIQTGIMAVRFTVEPEFIEQVDSEHSDFGANAYLNVSEPVALEQTNSEGESQMPKTTQTEEVNVTEDQELALAQDQAQTTATKEVVANAPVSKLILKEQLIRKDGLILAPGSDLTQFATNKIEYEFTPEFMSKIAMNTATILLQDDPEHPSITAGYTRQVDDKSLLKRDLPLSDGIVYAAGSDVTQFVNQKSVTTLSQEFLDSIDLEQSPLSDDLYTITSEVAAENMGESEINKADMSTKHATIDTAKTDPVIPVQQTPEAGTPSLESQMLGYLKNDISTEDDQAKMKFLTKVVALFVEFLQIGKEVA